MLFKRIYSWLLGYKIGQAKYNVNTLEFVNGLRDINYSSELPQQIVYVEVSYWNGYSWTKYESTFTKLENVLNYLVSTRK